MRLHRLLLALLLGCVGSLTAPAGEWPRPVGAEPRLEVHVRHGLLTVRLDQAPWAAVLSELEHHLGIQIVVRGALPGTVTQVFEAVPLEQGLRRLFRGANTLWLYGQDGTAAPTLTRVWLILKEGGARERWLLSSHTGGAASEQETPSSSQKTGEGLADAEEATSVGQSAADTDQEAQLNGLHAAAWQGHTEAVRQAVFNPDHTIQTTAVELLAAQDRQGAVAVLLGAAKSAQPMMRLQALQLLRQMVEVDERAVLAALEEGLFDEDGTVKDYAIHALADHGGAAVLGPLRRALRDPDPATRMRVIESALQTKQGLLLLQEALADEDATVRAHAAFWLGQAGAEGQ
jgi:HEAT repeats